MGGKKQQPAYQILQSRQNLHNFLLFFWHFPACCFRCEMLEQGRSAINLPVIFCEVVFSRMEIKDCPGSQSSGLSPRAFGDAMLCSLLTPAGCQGVGVLIRSGGIIEEGSKSGFVEGPTPERNRKKERKSWKSRKKDLADKEIAGFLSGSCNGALRKSQVQIPGCRQGATPVSWDI